MEFYTQVLQLQNKKTSEASLEIVNKTLPVVLGLRGGVSSGLRLTMYAFHSDVYVSRSRVCSFSRIFLLGRFLTPDSPGIDSTVLCLGGYCFCGRVSQPVKTDNGTEDVTPLQKK